MYYYRSCRSYFNSGKKGIIIFIRPMVDQFLKISNSSLRKKRIIKNTKKKFNIYLAVFYCFRL